MYLSEGDLKNAAAFLGLGAEEFEMQFVIRTRTELRLRKPEGRQCFFHRNNCCAIHPAKPTQCRAFPFWPELLEDEAAWEETARYCPGMNRGELIQIEAAQAVAAEMREAYPAMY
ncbi:MAG: YkgJ family cysteine cluster protein [Acidobacteriota bacterium]|nr:YkgJ family cysteine cluster protein [Acidobacteriota bacterium]